MSNKCKDIDIENRKYYFSGNINIKNIDPNKINKDEKKIFLFIRYMTFKDRRHVRSINVKFYALLRLRITHEALQLLVFFFSFFSFPSFFSRYPEYQEIRSKNYFTDHRQLIQLTVLEIQFRYLKYMTVTKIRKNLSNIPFLSKR